MAQNVGGPEIERLIQLLARLPGLGPRSARRAALHLIKKRDTLLAPLSDAMRVANERIVVCSSCGNVDTADPCTICRDPRRDGSILVVVEDVSDLWALERSGAISARYHVLGGVEFRMSSWFGVTGEAQWTTISDALGTEVSSASEAFGESNLGGLGFRVRFVVGR